VLAAQKVLQLPDVVAWKGATAKSERPDAISIKVQLMEPLRGRFPASEGWDEQVLYRLHQSKIDVAVRGALSLEHTAWSQHFLEANMEVGVVGGNFHDDGENSTEPWHG
ncbi:MAG TPA: hypothetical protein VIN58_25175, partial [Roseateles sp.]